LAEVFELETVFLSTRGAQRANDFIKHMGTMGGRIPQDIRLAESRERAVRDADIVIAATTSETPVFSGGWLKPGSFVAAVGAYEATMREVDSETIRRASNLVIDSRTDCLDHAGDLVIPISEGIIRREQVAEISELVTGKRPPRGSSTEITYYKSIGVPIQDLITAQHMARRAAERGIGIEVEIGGDTM
jgi:ornithine cyclodeaminase